MVIISVRLNQFRNIKYLEISLSPGINLFFGANGQGKTNILESIEILSTTRSQRASRESELVAYDGDAAGIHGKFMKNGLDFDIDINIFKDRRRSCMKNGKPATADSVFGSVNVVKFFPDDVEIIKGPPAGRRRYADMEISLTDRAYYHDYKSYTKAIDSRNRLLKALAELAPGSLERARTLSAIESYDEVIPGLAYSIYAGRMRFLNDISESSARMHSLISSGAESSAMGYVLEGFENPSLKTVLTDSEFKENLTNLLKKNLKNDTIKGFTGAGPHRDDIEFFIDGRSARSFGSTGQVKTLAMSLKLAQIDYVFKKTGDHPVLLIDDLTSEFDTERLFNIINNISRDIQAMVTSTNQRMFVEAFRDSGAAFFEVSSGGVRNG